jgi:flagellar motility protein MotE (MotC chaperone)
LAYSAAVKEWASTFGNMEASNAAKIMEEMTGDTNLVADILLNLDTTQRAAIMAAMDTVFAAKLTKIMYP